VHPSVYYSPDILNVVVEYTKGCIHFLILRVLILKDLFIIKTLGILSLLFSLYVSYYVLIKKKKHSNVCVTVPDKKYIKILDVLGDPIGLNSTNRKISECRWHSFITSIRRIEPFFLLGQPIYHLDINGGSKDSMIYLHNRLNVPRINVPQHLCWRRLIKMSRYLDSRYVLPIP